MQLIDMDLSLDDLIKDGHFAFKVAKSESGNYLPVLVCGGFITVFVNDTPFCFCCCWSPADGWHALSRDEYRITRHPRDHQRECINILWDTFIESFTRSMNAREYKNRNLPTTAAL